MIRYVRYAFSDRFCSSCKKSSSRGGFSQGMDAFSGHQPSESSRGGQHLLQKIPSKTTAAASTILRFYSSNYNPEQQYQQFNKENIGPSLLDSDDKSDLKITQLPDGIMKISFNRPQKANAMGKNMLSQLHAIIGQLTRNDEESIGRSTRCIILTSCTDKVFSAGADLKERSKMTAEEASAFVTSLRSSLDGLATLPMPMIACVEVRRYHQFLFTI